MTQVFTYEITMKVQVLAESKDEADERVDTQGGYLANGDRTARLIAVTKLTEPVKLASVSKPKKKPASKV